MRKFLLLTLSIVFLLVFSAGCVQSNKTGVKAENSAEAKTEAKAESSSDEKADAKTDTKIVKILISTSMGDIEAELYPDKAPVTVENFVGYVNDKFYDGLIFHRVIPNFMIQGGGMDGTMTEKPTKQPIKIESDNGLKNKRGTLAMARTQEPNSATSQFFINHVDNPFLDYKAPTIAGYGYAVFGEVTKGMDVVDKIAAVPTTTAGFHQDVPAKPVIIKSIRVIE